MLAVDLYRRTGPPEISDPAAAMRWIRELSDPQVLADVQAAVDCLAAHESVAGRPIGVAGFCMGGQYALLAACSCRGLSACVPFYGMLAYADGLDAEKKPRSPLEATPDLTCPVLGLYGEDDAQGAGVGAETAAPGSEGEGGDEEDGGEESTVEGEYREV